MTFEQGSIDTALLGAYLTVANKQIASSIQLCKEDSRKKDIKIEKH